MTIFAFLAEKIHLDGIIGGTESAEFLITFPLLHCRCWIPRNKESRLIRSNRTSCNTSVRRTESLRGFGPTDPRTRHRSKQLTSSSQQFLVCTYTQSSGNRAGLQLITSSSRPWLAITRFTTYTLSLFITHHNQRKRQFSISHDQPTVLVRTTDTCFDRSAGVREPPSARTMFFFLACTCCKMALLPLRPLVARAPFLNSLFSIVN